MKLTILLLVVTALLSVACNKKEEAPATATENSTATAEGHDKEHHHVTDQVDHPHADDHHQDHDHAAHHPNHDEESGEAHNH